MIQLIYPVKAIIFSMILLEMHLHNLMKSNLHMMLLIKTCLLNCKAQSYINLGSATLLKRLTAHVKLVEVIFFSRGTSSD